MLNSYLLSLDNQRPIQELKRFLEKTIENDKYTVAEIPQLRDGWKRTFIFKHCTRREHIKWFDLRVKRYYDGLPRGVTLKEVLRFLRKYKKRALFFRQVELP